MGSEKRNAPSGQAWGVTSQTYVLENDGMSDPDATARIGYAEFFALDFRKLPLGVLKVISQKLSQEIHRRNGQASKDSMAVQAAFVGVPISFEGGDELASRYLNLLLKQDWSHLFQGGDPAQKYYVYAHVKPDATFPKLNARGLALKFHGQPFYIGKGCGPRAYDLKRNQGHGALLRELLAEGVAEKRIVHIVCDGLTEAEALELESKLIYYLGTKYEQGRSGMLVNLDIPARPELLPWKKWVKMNKEAAIADAEHQVTLPQH
jgi:hypothetical protein